MNNGSNQDIRLLQVLQYNFYLTNYVFLGLLTLNKMYAFIYLYILSIYLFITYIGFVAKIIL